MPLTNKGKKIMTAMKEEYGKKKGEQVFYASKNNGNIYGVEKASKGKAIKVKSYKGGGMDAGNKSNQAQSAAMGKAGVDNQVASATDYSGLGNRSNSTKDALTAQNKGARAAISPSTTTGNKVASAAMNFVLPGSGYLYNKAIDKTAMGYNKPKVTTPPINTGGGNNNSQTNINPVTPIKPVDANLVLPQDNFFNFKAYKVGGLSGGVRYGPPPKRGPNPNVPPVKLNKGSKKEIKAGYHRMPNGSIMKNSAHKGGK